MIREAIATGRTVDDAIEAACTELGLPREEVDIEILDLPRKGFLGLTHTPAKVRVSREEPDPKPVPAPRAERPAAPPPPRRPEAAERRPVAPAAPAPTRQPEPEPYVPAAPRTPTPVGELTAKAKAAGAYLEQVLHAMGLGEEVTVSIGQEEQNIQLAIDGDAAGTAIGRRGETLDALQYLVGLATNRVEGDYARVIIDSGNYRDKRRHALEQLAKKLAAAAMRTGRATTLEPMNPYERRIIHATVSEIEGVTSTSVGEEPNRCVVISSTNPRPQGPREDHPQGDRPPPRRDDRRDSRGRGPRDDRRGPRREKPAPYQESGRREVPPAEAADKPLYGKIEL